VKQILFAVSVVAVLSFSCGGPQTYGGTLAEASTAEGIIGRSSRESLLSVSQHEQQATIDGWEKPITATIDGATLNIDAGGDVLGGSGSLIGDRLSFTMLVSVRRPGQPVGLATVSFSGQLGARIDEADMRDTVSSSREEAAERVRVQSSNDRLFTQPTPLPTFDPQLAQPIVELAPPVATRR
jgi:hypothetical protein